jgi:hypothetical protein
MPNKAQAGRDEGRVVGPSPGHDLDLDQVKDAVSGIRFGEVRVIIQDGVIVQIERMEKRRLR